MKAFYAIFLLVFLASCGANTVTQVINETTDNPIVEEVIVNIEENIPTEVEEVIETEPTPEPEAPVEEVSNEVVEETIDEIDAAVAEISSEDAPAEDVSEAPVEAAQEAEQTSATNLIELSTSYTNPAMQAVMNIALEVNSDNVIESIAVTSPNYKGMVSFNGVVQDVIGMTVSEASEFYVSGSSLASPAFQDALKGSL